MMFDAPRPDHAARHPALHRECCHLLLFVFPFLEWLAVQDSLP